MPGTGRVRVLIANDDPLLRSSLRAQVVNLGHLVVAEAADGQEAVSLARQLRPDLVVMDVEMPGMDGLAVLGKVKLDHPDIEVVMLTGHGSHEEKRLAEELGVFAYLAKPQDIDVLAKTIKRACDEKRRRLEPGCENANALSRSSPD